MQGYKTLLVKLLALILAIFLGILGWLWNGNRKNTDPLPIVDYDMIPPQDSATASADKAIDNTRTATTNILYMQAADSRQLPLEDVIVRFEARYPNVQVVTSYPPADALLNLPHTNATTRESVPLAVPIDIIIAEDTLADSQMALLQSSLDTITTETNQAESRNLVPFRYAIKQATSVEAVILTENPVAINFRNFLLSSDGQDILEQYNYDNIDGYNNSVDDLFNPPSRGTTAVEHTEVVVDILSNEP